MKRILLFSLLISLAVNSFAQSAYLSVPMPTYGNGTTRQSGENGIPYANNSIINYKHSLGRTRASGTVIGITTYDEQPSNQRLFPGPGGTLAATWTGSKKVAAANDPNPWPDRGTFYNYFDGTNWFYNQPNLDTVKIENIRSGFPSNVILGNGGEWMCSHIPTDTLLGTMTRANAGSGNWTVTNPTSLNVMWPHATAWGNTIHVIGTNDHAHKNLYLDYSRSTDGGQTWDVLNTRLPEEDSADCIFYMGADNYSIDANKNTVAIVAGGISNGVFLWKSTDNGSNWTRSTIVSFPNCGGVGKDRIITDSVDVTDGLYSVIVDNSGKVHVWYSDLFLTVPASDTALNYVSIYYATKNYGLRYWNDGMPADGGYLIATDTDLVNTGRGSLSLYGPYGLTSSYISMPTAAIDTASNTIFCVFSEAVPFSNLDGTGGTVGADTTAHSYRDLFGVYSTDGGATWSEQANLTVSALAQEENVYPAASKSVVRNGSVDVTWMRDETPGTSLIRPDLNQNGKNDIVFQSFTMADFNGAAGVKNVNGITYQDLKVYPNPSNGLVNMNVAGLANEKASITVTDLLGETVKVYNNVQLTGNIQMNASNLANGIYVVKIQTSTHILTGKITIAH